MLNESHRLAENQRTLLEKMPGVVLVIQADGSIEYMNPTAAAFFQKDGNTAAVKRSLQQLEKSLYKALQEESATAPHLLKIQRQHFECHFAPFVGYKGDNLFWVFLKTVKKQDGKLIVLEGDADTDDIVGFSKAMKQLQVMASRVAKTDATVMITGESGTGKELIAKLIHRNSMRRDKPFLSINCNAINDLLLESDLFGYEKGAFTGAEAQKSGKFEVVDGGSIFLDEIGDISPRMQSVLLRVLQHGEIIRVGGTSPLKVDVRVIAATNCNLERAVKEGKFRLDLYYRLNIIKLITPPLRDRKEDLPDLTRHFVKKYSSLFGIDVDFEPNDILKKLESHDWPGNIRELENVVQRAILMSENGKLSLEAFSFDISLEKEDDASLSSIIKNFNGSPLKNIIDHIEKEIILEKLASNGGNVGITAEKLEICKAALYEKMKRYDISAKRLR